MTVESWSLHRTLQTPNHTPDPDPDPDHDTGAGRDTRFLLAPITIESLENGWPDPMQQDTDGSQTFHQPLAANTSQPAFPEIFPHSDCRQRLGELQKAILVDLELVKACKTATDCAQLSLSPELTYNSSFLVGRMLGHSRALLGILDSFRSISSTPSYYSSGNDTIQPGTGSLHCDVPTVFSIFSCYVCLIRIYRTIFSCIHDSMPVLLSLQQPVPQLFPGINLAGFTMETRLDLQVQILVQVSEDMLSKLDVRLGICGGANADEGIFESTRAHLMLSMMVEEEAREQPPLYEPRGPCKSLRDILADLKQTINGRGTK
ncbi:hypothetical protein AYL99_08990 [Fonsecaea erecta]|uniref:Aflatoxin regulatory protein domain-containing protein n=1 Tax=Fonsecaea erecta TaxID=1367422 RepID=A0A178ZAT0_9EURO|nr:hypothetical protein AYL99_08990 [Fonsecaea erecta]OAP56878.1 hypothetical protein AYL99_08990 [Fonsecaea erecta]